MSSRKPTIAQPVTKKGATTTQHDAAALAARGRYGMTVTQPPVPWDAVKTAVASTRRDGE